MTEVESEAKAEAIECEACLQARPTPCCADKWLQSRFERSNALCLSMAWASGKPDSDGRRNRHRTTLPSAQNGEHDEGHVSGEPICGIG